jgi:hypothetical protein
MQGSNTASLQAVCWNQHDINHCHVVQLSLQQQLVAPQAASSYCTAMSCRWGSLPSDCQHSATEQSCRQQLQPTMPTYAPTDQSAMQGEVSCCSSCSGSAAADCGAGGAVFSKWLMQVCLYEQHQHCNLAILHAKLRHAYCLTCMVQVLGETMLSLHRSKMAPALI